MVLGGGTLSLTGLASTTNSQRFNGLTVNSGGSSIQLAANATANPLLLSLGAITRNAGGTVDFTLPTGVQSATNGVTTTTSTLNNGLLVATANGAAFATVGGSDWATLSGTNIVGLSTGAGYTTTTAAGTTAANYTNANMDVTNSAGTLSGTVTPNTFRFNTAAADTVTLATGANVLGAGSILETSAVGSNLSTITGGTLEASSSSGELVVIQNNASGGLTIASTIADNSASSPVTKSGAGLLTLSGTNTYSGQTYVNGGRLSIGAVGNLGAPLAANAILLFDRPPAKSSHDEIDW